MVEVNDWKGFCELESEPALFNVMLRDFGVKGVKVEEVISLDEDMMATLNKPVYGLIFLSRWREDDPEKQEASCPEGLWFANQTATNACATVALLNIINNVEDIDLGDNLQSFKEFTMPFTPALRGVAISNYEFIKRIHNSFARKMDILNADHQLKTETTSKRSRNQVDQKDLDTIYHFIAYVAALGRVWKFDGLERQPQVLGTCQPDDDWLALAKPNILTKMREYEEGQIEFSILSLSQDPLPGLLTELAINVKSLEVINQRLTSTGGALAFDAVNHLGKTLLEADESYTLCRDMIDRAAIPASREQEYRTCTMLDLESLWNKLTHDQRQLRVSIREEQQSRQADENYAEGRRYDYSPAIRTWLRLLAHKQVIEKLL
ncbi:ubiquitin C-terminal hydrolase 37 [Aspergillus saccharolyticus JOP 1030-1]|uniref:ubiquitinyl hydrolase 1 n=1 Tax=Aspergillus saccharolyticus JOP 1030-1 TaxID=1450539 RepID=A0A318ZCC7_9EURO|nr:cysteine proteinase [Aspergillus saccharolyticus JOP 1030-1]PYH41140.1 cysteine proteinase [Aspergillus saccharolyticus JOP 1030-1]